MFLFGAAFAILVVTYSIKVATNMNDQHQYAEQKYDLLRQESLSAALLSLPATLRENIALTNINSATLAIAKNWEYDNRRSDSATWSWNEGIRKYSYRHPKRFELAIWYANAMLCGLSIGKPTYSGDKLRLDVIESAPGVHPLKGQIVAISVAAFSVYARAIGASQIRIMRPVNETVTRYYQQFGFRLFKGKESNIPTHLWLDL